MFEISFLLPGAIRAAMSVNRPGELLPAAPYDAVERLGLKCPVFRSQVPRSQVSEAV